MLSKDKAEPSTSPHNFRMVVVNRKDKEGAIIEGDERVCINVAPMNPDIEDFNYNPPRIEVIKDKLSKSKYYSELDAEKAFNQQQLHESCRHLLSYTDDNGR